MKTIKAIADNHDGYSRFMRDLIERLDFKVVLECGTGGGGCAMTMAGAENKPDIITIDMRVPHINDSLSRNFPTIHFIYGNTLEVEDEVTEILDGREIDLLFLDSEHDGETARKELDIYSKYLKDGAVIAIDDISLCPPMKIFWDSIELEKEDVSFLHVRDGAGFGIVKWEGEQE
jgi:predicted O-methyltransferase YrrM